VGSKGQITWRKVNDGTTETWNKARAQEVGQRGESTERKDENAEIVKTTRKKGEGESARIRVGDSWNYMSGMCVRDDAQ
jgi:hypothetical protein